jgi:hypothetical protein
MAAVPFGSQLPRPLAPRQSGDPPPTARPLLAHREPAQTRYCNPLRGLEVNEAKRLRALEAENAKLKRLLADTMLDNTAVKDLLRKW